MSLCRIDLPGKMEEIVTVQKEVKMLPRQVSLWNQTQRAYPLDRTMTAFLEEQFGKTPDREAVRFEGTGITYRELNRRANRLAARLKAGVYMERSVEMVTALVAILKAGGAYVPFDPEYPQDRLAFMFADSAVSTVLTQRRFEGRGAPEGLRALYLDDAEWQVSGPEDDPNPPLTSTPDSAAMVMTCSVARCERPSEVRVMT